MGERKYSIFKSCSALKQLLSLPKVQIFLACVTLLLFVLQIHWGFWRSLDLPTDDEAWALVDGFRMARGMGTHYFQLWDSPLSTITYAGFALLFKTIAGTFYAQRIFYTVCAVLALFYLLNRLLGLKLAWLGAAWLAVSPLLIDLSWNRTDFLGAIICVWAALGVLDRHSLARSGIATFLALAAFFFRPDAALFLAGMIIYLVCGKVYDLLRTRPRSTPMLTRLILSGGIAVLIFGILFAAGVAFISRNKSIDSYFAWVFANNRVMNQNAVDQASYIPLWDAFERDYGTEHTLKAILTNPKSLSKDLIRNIGNVFYWVKYLQTTTAWGKFNLQVDRWFLAILLLVLLAVYAVRRHWRTGWKDDFQQKFPSWIHLLCLVPLLFILVFFYVSPLQILILAPVVFGGSLHLVHTLLKPFVRVSQYLFYAFVILILVLAPNARNFQGEMPVQQLVNYFNATLQPGQKITMLGNLAITVCPYLTTSSIECMGDKWYSEKGNQTLSDRLSQQNYDFLIFDRSMGYSLSSPANEEGGLNRVISGEDLRWEKTWQYSDIQVFRFRKIN